MSNTTTLATEKLVEIAIADLQDSPTNPRHTYDDDSIVELVDSIRKHGIIQPLIVRPLSKGYEIAAGHRRRYGAKLAGLISVPCIIRSMSDEQVIDTHIIENVHRKDLDPLDEANLYKLMRDRGVTIEQIVERSGRSAGYIARRLSLVNLIPSLQADIQAGTLPIEYGFELAKYPADAQAEVEKEMYGSTYVYDGKDVTEAYEAVMCADCDKLTVFTGDELEDEAASVCSHCQSENLESFDGDLEVEAALDRSEIVWSVADIRRWFERSYVVSLAKAKFAMDDTRLREDGLACVNCPQRTGANAGLFGEIVEDFCLNRQCFDGKTLRVVQITRDEKAAELGVDLPIVQHVRHGATLLPGAISSREFTKWAGREKPCEFIVKAFGADEMDVIEGCFLSSGCAEHHWENRPDQESAGSKSTETEDEIGWKKKLRKEEIWNVKVGETVRRRVLAETAKAFSEEVEVLFTEMIDAAERMWQQEDHGIKHKVIEPILVEVLGKPIPEFERKWNQAAQRYDEVGITRAGFLGSLKPEEQAMVFFLFTYGHTGAMLSNTWADQHPVAELAERFEVNYQLIDAQVRVELSPKKHLKRHQAYLQQCETGDPNREVPILYAVRPEDGPIPEPTAVPESVSEETGPVEPSKEETTVDTTEEAKTQSCQHGQIIIGRPAGLEPEPDYYNEDGSSDELATIFSEELERAKAEEGV